VNRGDVGQKFQPGDHVRWFADKFGWQLARRTVLVEGETDVKYFHLASHLYHEANGRHLLSEEFGVVSTGFGDAGGTDGIVERFPAFRQIISLDCSATGKQLFRAVALVDGDAEGHKACDYLTNRYTGMVKNRDVFVLQRIFPRESQDPRKLVDIMKAANKPWHDLDCEIEDLLDRDVLDLFVAENGGCLKRALTVKDNGHHFDFTTAGKSNLCRWVPEIVVLKEMSNIVEVLRSLRYYLGINPDGE
jgi:hypothetical protein